MPQCSKNIRFSDTLFLAQVSSSSLPVKRTWLKHWQWPDGCGLQGQHHHLFDPTSPPVHSWNWLGPLNFTGKIQAMVLQVNLEATFRKMVGCIHVQPNWHLGKMKVGGGWLSQKREWSDTMHQKTGLSFVRALLWEAKIKAICQSSPFPFQIISLLETAMGGMKF